MNKQNLKTDLKEKNLIGGSNLSRGRGAYGLAAFFAHQASRPGLPPSLAQSSGGTNLASPATRHGTSAAARLLAVKGGCGVGSSAGQGRGGRCSLKRQIDDEAAKIMSGCGVHQRREVGRWPTVTQCTLVAQ
jgi:hypothetical protein